MLEKSTSTSSKFNLAFVAIINCARRENIDPKNKDLSQKPDRFITLFVINGIPVKL